MTPQEQPDSQARDEQTETELVIALARGYFDDLKYDYPNLSDEELYDNCRAEAKADLAAWRRQQTAQVLQRLKKKSVDYYKAGEVVMLDVIDAELAALRVGLEGSSDD